MVMAGMGFDAAIMEGVNEQLKSKVGWVAYVVSGFKSLMFPAVRMEISVDGGEFTRHRARTVVVGNVGFLQAGLPLLPDAAIDDGLLDVVILHPAQLPVLGAAGLAGAAQAQAHRRPRQPDDRRARSSSAPPPTPRASSTATRSARAASCGWSACTAGCWSASPADPSFVASPTPTRRLFTPQDADPSLVHAVRRRPVACSRSTSDGSARNPVNKRRVGDQVRACWIASSSSGDSCCSQLHEEMLLA